MTLRSLVKSYSRPLRFVAISSAVALALALGASSATLADSGHDYGKYKKGKHGDGRYRDDHDYDRGRDGHYDSGRYHRDPGYRYDGYRNDYRESYRGGYYGRGYYDRGYYDRGYDHGRFVVPHHIYRDRYRDYDRYYRGAVYYAPHHHPHRVYLFPVIVGGFVEYRPYAYCGEAYYPGHYYDGYGY